VELHQETKPVTFIQRQSITEAKKQQEITSAFIVTQKIFLAAAIDFCSKNTLAFDTSSI
jgi:hypothetical protein